jgi:ABC-type amino acid transport substrate-binding protein
MRRLAPYALLLVVLALTGCGGSGPGEPTNTPTPALPTIPAIIPGSDVARIRDSSVLRVGIKFDQPGFGYKDPSSGAIDGFEVELARAISRAMGLSDSKLQLVQVLSTDRIPALQQNRVDLVIATMSITNPRESLIVFSRSYYQAGETLVTRKGAQGITGIDSLEGRKVCAVEGSQDLATIEQRAPKALTLPLTGVADCITALRTGVVDAVAAQDTVLLPFVDADSALQFVGGQFTQEFYGVGVASGRRDLVAFVDAVIARSLADGSWDTWYNRFIAPTPGMANAVTARARLPKP